MPEDYETQMAEFQQTVTDLQEAGNLMVDDRAPVEEVVEEEVIETQPIATVPTADEIADALQRRFQQPEAVVEEEEPGYGETVYAEDIEQNAVNKSFKLLRAVQGVTDEIDAACSKLEGLPEGFKEHVKGWFSEVKDPNVFRKGAGQAAVANAVGQAVMLGLYKPPTKTTTSAGQPGKSLSKSDPVVPAGESRNLSLAQRAFGDYMSESEIKRSFK